MQDDVAQDLFPSSPSPPSPLTTARMLLLPPALEDSPEVKRLIQERDEAKSAASQLQNSLIAATEFAREAKVSIV